MQYFFLIVLVIVALGLVANGLFLGQCFLVVVNAKHLVAPDATG